jgi:hypothetical protein
MDRAESAKFPEAATTTATLAAPSSASAPSGEREEVGRRVRLTLSSEDGSPDGGCGRGPAEADQLLLRLSRSGGQGEDQGRVRLRGKQSSGAQPDSFCYHSSVWVK